MSFEYTGLQSTATDLIQKFGRQLTFTRTTDGTYDPDTGTSTTSDTTYQKYACVFDYNESETDGTNILVGDRRLLAEQHTYQVDDMVSIDGESYRVLSISENRPSTKLLTMTLQVRK